MAFMPVEEILNSDRAEDNRRWRRKHMTHGERVAHGVARDNEFLEATARTGRVAPKLFILLHLFII
jgi:hypothetical protein